MSKGSLATCLRIPFAIAGLLACVLLAAIPSRVAAQAEAEAHALYEAGAAAFADGRFDEALRYFQEAHALSAHVELLYNVGQAADRARRDDVALDAFRRYLAARPDAPHAVEIEGRIRVLERTIAARESEPTESAPSEVEAPPPEDAVVGTASDDAGQEVAEDLAPAIEDEGPDAGGLVLAVTGGVAIVVGAILIGAAVPDLAPPRAGVVYEREAERQASAEALSAIGASVLGLGVIGAIVAGVILGTQSHGRSLAAQITPGGLVWSF